MMSQTFQPLSVREKEMSLDTGNFIKLGIRLPSEQCVRCVLPQGLPLGVQYFELWCTGLWQRVRDSISCLRREPCACIHPARSSPFTAAKYMWK